MFDDVLVPTDGSDCAAVAVGRASDLATRYDATVHVLNVVDSRALDGADYAGTVRERRAEMVGDVADDVGVEATVEAVRTGVPHEEILAYATAEGIDLVVMGTHGRTGLERYLIGSVTERVVRLADVPVLTIREDAADGGARPFEEIVVPTDGSEGADAAVDPALDLADRYDARVHVLSAVDPMAVGVDVRAELVVDALESAAHDAVDAVAARAREAGVAGVETAVEFGRPHTAIREYVEDRDVDLVVMGTHGRSGLERYLLGSVTEKLVRTSPVPVLTVRAAESDEE